MPSFYRVPRRPGPAGLLPRSYRRRSAAPEVGTPGRRGVGRVSGTCGRATADRLRGRVGPGRPAPAAGRTGAEFAVGLGGGDADLAVGPVRLVPTLAGVAVDGHPDLAVVPVGGMPAALVGVRVRRLRLVPLGQRHL